MNIKREAKIIDNMIKTRENYTLCRFYISLSDGRKDIRYSKDRNLRKVLDILKKHNVEYHLVDTVDGTYNLNRDFYETDIMICAVEYGGVYPVKWDCRDTALFEYLEFTGKIIVLVAWYNADGSFKCMNH